MLGIDQQPIEAEVGHDLYRIWVPEADPASDRRLSILQKRFESAGHDASQPKSTSFKIRLSIELRSEIRNSRDYGHPSIRQSPLVSGSEKRFLFSIQSAESTIYIGVGGTPVIEAEE